VDVTLDLAGPRLRSRRAVARVGVPLDARAEGKPDGYEAFNAAELDAISQARH
jgi:hypothetical protein